MNTITETRSRLDEFATAPHATAENVPARVEPHTLAILSRSEIDAQMETAGTRPRDVISFRNTVKAIALINEDAAADCHYALPARKEDGDPIEGPSIRFAEILAYAWHNCRVGARVIDEASDHVTAQGIFNDVEGNIVTTQEVRRRITDRRGRRYSADMINMTANAACAIARRNAILQAIPKPLWADLYQDARRMAAGSETELAPRRDKALAAFGDLGVSRARIFAMLGVETAEQIDLDRLARLRGIYTAVKDGAVSIRELDQPDGGKASEEKVKSSLDSFAASDVSSAPPPSTESPAAPTLRAGEGSGGESFPQDSSAAVAAPTPAPGIQQWADDAVRKDAISRALAIASRIDLELADRLEQLDVMRIDLQGQFPHPFISTLIETSAKVAKKQTPKASAQKYLTSLKE
jgi:hypothetical protein